jgi:hypothetical protein
MSKLNFSFQILVVELIRGYLNSDVERRRKVLTWKVSSTVQNLYKYVGFFLFGAACCQLATDIAKYTIGRLRPHFISVSLVCRLHYKLETQSALHYELNNIAIRLDFNYGHL